MGIDLAEYGKKAPLASSQGRSAWAASPWLEIGATLVYFVLAIVSATHRKLWFDEVDTALLSRLPVHELWKALASGADTNPPLLYLPVHLLNRLTSNIELACRLPSIFEFYLMMAAAYWLARKHVSALYASIGSFVPFLTIAGSFATEGRGYSAALGFSALGLLCWSNATTYKRRILWLFGISASIAAAVSNHYSAALIITALAGGEAVRCARRRQIDWPVAAAIAAGGIPLIAFQPLMGAIHRYLLSYWAKPSIHEVLSSLSGWRLAALLIAVLFAIQLVRNLLDTQPRGPRTEISVPIHEVAAWVILLLSPVQGYLQGLVTGGFTMRYALPMVIPVSLCAALYAFRVFRGAIMPGLLLLAILVGICAERLLIVTVRPNIGEPEADWIANYPFPDEGPVAIGNAIVFSPLDFYAKEPLRGRLTYIGDPELSAKYLHMNSPDLNLTELAKFSSLPVADYAAFIKSHPRFTLVNDESSWILSKLVADKVPVQQLDCKGTWCVYRVGQP